MAINPLLLNVKPISELPTVDNPTDGHLLFYDGGDELKKVDIIEFQSLIGGIAKPLAIADASPTVDGWYKPTSTGTYANAGGLVAEVGYDTLFYFDGTTWSKVEVLMPNSINIHQLSTIQNGTILSSFYTFIANNLLYQVKDGETFTVGTDFLIDETKLNMIYVNTQTIKWTEGFYITDNGNKSPASWMSVSNFIAIQPNRYYKWLKGGNVNFKDVAFYDENFDYISSIYTTGAGQQIYKTPANAYYARYSKENSENPQPFLLPNDFIKVSQTKEDYHFKTIEEAIDYADNYLGKKCTIEIHGKITLSSTLNIMSNHIFIGQSVYDSIIEFVSNSELLRTSVATYKHLQFRRQGVFEGYCVHPDYAGEGVVEFENCLIINTNGACIGSGSHMNQTLRLKNCELKSISGGTHLSPTLYWHNNVSNVANQNLELINCTVYSDYERPLQIADQNLNLGDGLNRSSTILAINTRFYGALYGLGNMIIKQPSGNGVNLVSGYIKLHPLSSGNNIQELNYV